MSARQQKLDKTSIPPCNFVVVYPEKPLRARKTYEKIVVKRGERILGGLVSFASPEPCVISPSTAIKFEKPYKYKVEKLKNNYLLEIYYDGFVDRLIYPAKSWETLQEDVLDPFFSGARRVYAQGCVLYGPPGSGKTSLAEALSLIFGLRLVKIQPYAVYAKYVGESEKNLVKVFMEAESSEPSILLADDSEWLLLRRELKSGETTSTLQLSLSNIVLEKVEQWNKSQRKILFIATTNAPISLLDQALLRSGRIGKAIYVPLPDFEAVYTLLTLEGVEEGLARKWAVKAINMGLSMADVKLEIAEKLKRGKEPKLEPKIETGYRRFFADVTTPRQSLNSVVEKFLSELSTQIPVEKIYRHRMERGLRTVLWFRGPTNVAVALAHALISHREKIPTVTLVDFRKVDDAIEASNVVRGFLIVPDTSLPEYQANIDGYFNNAFNVAFAGDRIYHTGLEIPIPPRLSLSANEVYTAITVITLTFYNVEFDEKDVKDLVSIANVHGVESLLKILDRAGFYGSRVGELKTSVSREVG